MTREKDAKKLVTRICRLMNWPELPINRIKFSMMETYMGLCIDDGEGLYIVLSDFHHETELQMLATLCHEVIHGHININLGKHRTQHKHNKRFRRFAHKMARKIGILSYKDIL